MNDAKKAFLNISGTTVYYFVQLLTSIIITKVIGFEAAGINSLALTISNVFYPVALYGVRGFQVGDIRNRYSEGNYAFARVVTTLAAVILFSISLVFMNLTPVVIACSIAYMAVRVLESFTDLFFAIYQKRDHFHYIYNSYVLKSLSTLLLFSIAAIFSKNILVVISAMAFSYLLVFFCYDLRKLRLLTRIQLARANTMLLLRECMPLMIFTLVMPYINFMVRYSVQIVFGTEILGYYSSIAIFQSVISTMTSSIWLVYIPTFSKLYSDGLTRELRKIIGRIMIFVLAILIVGTVGILILGKPVLVLIYGAAIISYSYLLLPIVTISILLSVVMLFNSILISLNRNKLMLLTNSAGAAVITAITIPLVRNFGLSGANAAMAIGISIQLLLTMGSTLRIIHNRERELITTSAG